MRKRAWHLPSSSGSSTTANSTGRRVAGARGSKMPDMTLDQFITHLAGASARLKVEEHRSLERAALLVENEAKAEIGNYQSADGQFVGWAELAETTKDERVKEGFSENDPGL